MKVANTKSSSDQTRPQDRPPPLQRGATSGIWSYDSAFCDLFGDLGGEWGVGKRSQPRRAAINWDRSSLMRWRGKLVALFGLRAWSDDEGREEGVHARFIRAGEGEKLLG